MRSFWLTAILLLCAPLASAQTVRPVVPPGRIVIDVASAVSGASFEAVAPRSTSGARTAAGPNGPVALQSFRIGFQNGDHNIKTITMLRSGNLSEMEIGDNDGNDPFESRARYLPLAPQYTVQTVTRTCNGWCQIPIPASSDQAFVLTGFSLEHAQRDHDMSEIGIVPHLANGFVEVWYERYAVNAPGATVGGVSNVTLQYVTIPRARVAFETYCGRECGRAVTSSSNAVLQGFRCTYDQERAAHLLVIGINPVAAPRYEFQDNNTDDHGQCLTWVAGLR